MLRIPTTMTAVSVARACLRPTRNSAVIVAQASAFHDLHKCSAVAEIGDRLATIDRPKIGGSVLFLRGGGGSPCNTMRPGSRPTFLPSGVLNHPAVRPQ